MCRYLLHPPVSHDRLQLTDIGRVRVRFSRPWRNGVDAMELDPRNFIARLVPWVPAPGAHQFRYHGALSARAAIRSCIIPQRQPDGEQLALFKRAGQPGRFARCNSSASTSPPTPKLQRMSWARLLKRMGSWEMETCPDCGKPLRIVATLTDPHEIHRELATRGLLVPMPELTRSPSRGPPGQLELDLDARGTAGVDAA